MSIFGIICPHDFKERSENMRKLLLFFIMIFIIEIFTLIYISDAIGFVYTFLGVMLTSLIGGYIVKRYSKLNWQQVKSSLERGVTPEYSIFKSILLIIVGALVVLPGFIGDIIGIILLIPKVQQYVISTIKGYVMHKMRKKGTVIIRSNRFRP